MADWRKTERDLIDVFRKLGLRPKMTADHPDKNNGEWTVAIMQRLNISELARELAALSAAPQPEGGGA